MQKDLSTVSFVYLAASALSSDCVYLINVYKAKRNKITDSQSQDTAEHVICHYWVGGHSTFTAHHIKHVDLYKDNNKGASLFLIKVIPSYFS